MDKRPDELKAQNESVKLATDDAIENALKALSKKAEKNELKPTIKNLAKLAGVSAGSVNNREWAKLRLKVIKKIASASLSQDTPKDHREKQEKSETVLLKERIKHLISQNALLYDELLCLEESLQRAQKESEALSRRLELKTVK